MTLLQQYNQALRLGHDLAVERYRNGAIEIAEKYGVEKLPKTLQFAVLDRDGKLRKKDPNFATWLKG